MTPSTVTNKAIRLLACVATVTALALVAPATAQAAQSCETEKAPKAATLPAPGQEFELAVTSKGIGLTVNGEALTSAPLRGTLTVTIDKNPSDPKNLSVEAKPSDLTLSTKAPQAHSITVTQDNAVVDEKSILRLVKPNPATYEHLMAVNLKLTVSMPPKAPGKAEQDVILATSDPAMLRGSLTSFPPSNQPYALAQPVQLTAETGSDPVEATLDGFDVIVNQS